MTLVILQCWRLLFELIMFDFNLWGIFGLEEPEAQEFGAGTAFVVCSFREINDSGNIGEVAVYLYG